MASLRLKEKYETILKFEFETKNPDCSEFFCLINTSLKYLKKSSFKEFRSKYLLLQLEVNFN